MKTTESSPLLLVLASALLGHFLVVTPLVDAVRGRTGLRVCLALECGPDGAPPGVGSGPHLGPTFWTGPFDASSLAPREVWGGQFHGRVFPTDPGLVVELHRARVRLAPEAGPGVLRGVRLDLAEPTPDGSWRIVREGRAMSVGIRFDHGGTRALPPVDLLLPGVRGGDLQGRWLVATMLVDTPGGRSHLTHAHMDRSLAKAIAARAARAEEWAPERRVHVPPPSRRERLHRHR